jgi:hypothetical protein
VKIVSTIQRYTKPRVDPQKGINTSGDSPELRPGPSAITGGIQGYLLDGVGGAMGGVVGSFAGAKVAKKSNMLAGAATGFGVGAVTTAAVAAGLAAATGAVSTPVTLAMSAVSGGLAGLSGTLASTAGGSGILSGGIQGFVGNRTSGMAAGSLGGYIGLQVGKKTGSTGTAVLAGTGAGAVIGAGTTAALITGLGGGGLTPMMLVGSAVLGGLAGAVSTVSCSRRSAPRDGAYGGMLTGMAAGSMVGNPSLGLASAAASGFAARAKTNTGKAVLGVAGGAVAGALAGGLQGPAGIVSGAIAGAIAAPVGAIVGTTTRQVMRNAQIDLVNVINTKMVDPYLEKNKLTKTQKLAVGAAAGGLILGTTGMVAGTKGMAIMGTLGAIAGVVQTDRMISKVTEYRDAAKNADEFSAPPQVFGEVIAAQQKISEAHA